LGVLDLPKIGDVDGPNLESPRPGRDDLTYQEIGGSLFSEIPKITTSSIAALTFEGRWSRPEFCGGWRARWSRPEKKGRLFFCPKVARK